MDSHHILPDETITDTAILDDIIRQLEQGDTDWDCRSHALYEDEESGIYIEASVRWIIRTYSNYIDGYLEGEYEEIEGWQDLEIDAYIGDRPVEVDIGYIEENLVR